MKKLSIKEIAKLSGVSVATVSRVINNNGRFSEETRNRVEKVIKEQNYERNTIAKSLRVKKTDTIGILVPDISNSFFSNVVEETERFLFEQGYATIICNTARNKEKEQAYIKMLEGKMIDGLIVISGFNEFDSSKINSKIPVICIDRKPRATSKDVLIESNHLQGGYLATAELLAKGCQHISIIVHRPFLSSSRERLEGYLKALEEAGKKVVNEYIIFLDDDESLTRTEKAKLAMRACLKQHPEIDGVFAINDRLAIGAIHAVHEIGREVGKSIKVVGFDNDTISKYCYPPLTTISQDVEQIARRACETLSTLMKNPQATVEKHQVVPVDIVRRETT